MTNGQIIAAATTSISPDDEPIIDESRLGIRLLLSHKEDAIAFVHDIRASEAELAAGATAALNKVGARRFPRRSVITRSLMITGAAAGREAIDGSSRR